MQNPHFLSLGQRNLLDATAGASPRPTLTDGGSFSNAQFILLHKRNIYENGFPRQREHWRGNLLDFLNIFQ